jgi:Ca2+-dependent lipid-binding protein
MFNGIGVGKAASTRGCVHLVLSGNKLDKMDTFGKSDPFFQISRLHIADKGHGKYKTQWQKVIQSQYQLQTLNPSWEPTVVYLWDLCRGDFACPLLITVYDWDAHSAPDLIGSFTTNLEELLSVKILTKPIVRDKGHRAGQISVKARFFCVDDVVQSCRNMRAPSSGKKKKKKKDKGELERRESASGDDASSLSAILMHSQRVPSSRN